MQEITSFKPCFLKYGQTITSDVYSFTTPKKEPEEVSWLIINDIHDRPESISLLMNIKKEDTFDYVFFQVTFFVKSN